MEQSMYSDKLLEVISSLGKENDETTKTQVTKDVQLSEKTSYQPFLAACIVSPSMNLIEVETIEQVMQYYSMPHQGEILEQGVDDVVTECDLHGRKRRDSEILTTLAKNAQGHCLDLGTSTGRSAYKMRTNLDPQYHVYTVNMLPDQVPDNCEMITHVIDKDDIGSYLRETNTTGYTQIYADTMTWEMPPEIDDLGMVFVDAAHDTVAVYHDTMMVWDRVKPGGYVVWHDFNPRVRHQFYWIDASMKGAELFMEEKGVNANVINLKHSWMGIIQKPLV